MNIKELAQLAHAVNREWCLMNGDVSQPVWNEAPLWQKQSAIAGVEYLRDNPDAEPSDSHVSWLEHKVKDGWVYGSVKDASAKTHPCMVPYEELPEMQRVKDSLFHAIAHSVELESTEEEEGETEDGKDQS